ncbi:MAG TPA: TonB family protein [Candidatus Acidoferrales bacterium]|nr:TonB family protein [Candidatus Acidoferrales bacterium]
MPNAKLISVLAALGCLTAGAQTAADGPGVAVDLGGAAVMHRTPVNYPVGARGARVEGTVTVELAVDSAGNVADARVLSGPVELRRPSVLAVLQWHFAKDMASTTREVRITYQAPSAPTGAALAEPPTVRTGSMRAANSFEGRKVDHINILGLPAEARSELLSRLPMHEGDLYSADLVDRTFGTIRQFDEHLSVGFRSDSNTSLVLQIYAPGAVIEAPDAPKRITIGGNVQQAKLLSQVRPVYPPDAKAARVQGKVTLQALIAADGRVADLTVLSGDPMLAPSAIQAVSQWVYNQTLLNGVPVEVMTQIDVNYTLMQ